jgi:hypothetical protein
MVGLLRRWLVWTEREHEEGRINVSRALALGQRYHRLCSIPHQDDATTFTKFHAAADRSYLLSARTEERSLPSGMP